MRRLEQSTIARAMALVMSEPRFQPRTVPAGWHPTTGSVGFIRSATMLRFSSSGIGIVCQIVTRKEPDRSERDAQKRGCSITAHNSSLAHSVEGISARLMPAEPIEIATGSVLKNARFCAPARRGSVPCRRWRFGGRDTTPEAGDALGRLTCYGTGASDHLRGAGWRRCR